MNKNSMTILVADDNEFYRKSLGEILASLGHSVLYAENGDEAMVILQREQPQILLLDVNMSGTDGLELTRYVRNTYCPG